MRMYASQTHGLTLVVEMRFLIPFDALQHDFYLIAHENAESMWFILGKGMSLKPQLLLIPAHGAAHVGHRKTGRG